MSNSYSQFQGNPYGNTAANANPYGDDNYGAAANPYGGGGGVSHGMADARNEVSTDTIFSTVRNLMRDLRCTRRTLHIPSKTPA
jgi:hypothetical protein